MQRDALRDEVRFFLREARAPRLRTLRQFAEQEIVLPEGPFEGLPFRVSRQPVAGLWFDAIDSGRWNRFAFTAPVQFGKTLAGFVVPLLYHLFEVKETVIVGVPTMDVAGDKWQEEILPVIERSKYRDLLPTKGAGSRGGGKLESVRFGNGTTLKFMSGQGGDEKRSAFTSRVVVVTEADKMDESSGTSRESDPLRQLENRTKSFDDRKRIYLECTTSIDTGRIWQEYTKGSASRILSPCVHCGDWVAPEREHFAGWEDAADAIEAGEKGRFCCPSCGEGYSDTERRSMVDRSQIVHGTQAVGSDGAAVGEAPRTLTFGFRASAFHNLFWKQSSIAEACWKRDRAEDEESAERELTQFVWVKPYVPPKTDLTPLVIDETIRRQSQFGKGEVPPDVEFLTLGCDAGKYRLHWTCIGFAPNRRYVIDYGQQYVPTKDFGLKRALQVAYSELYDLAMVAGWGGKFTSQNWLDAQYETEEVEAFCRLKGPDWRPCHGRGESQVGERHFNRKTTTGKADLYEGEGYRLQANPTVGLAEVIVNADHWKSEIHKALEAPLWAIDRETGQPIPGQENAGAASALMLFKVGVNEHRTFVKHLTAEKQVEEFVPGRGAVRVWRAVRKQNHWLDATYLALAAGHFCGWRPGGIIRPDSAPATQPSRPGMKLPGGRPWIPRR